MTAARGAAGDFSICRENLQKSRSALMETVNSNSGMALRFASVHSEANIRVLRGIAADPPKIRANAKSDTKKTSDA